jgi:inner membrane protein
LSDFKGIEEKMVIRFNGTDYELTPGLPTNALSEKGLSASIPLTTAERGVKLPFQINLKIKGSEQLHFVPLSGDSKFTLRSSWPDPSFDGNNLPSERIVNDSGFTASWKFNKANLPFGTALKDFDYDEKSLAFGVTLIQTTDGYSKTYRCIRYAILFIGLTFSLFFIVELMQKKPVHPVQYILIGLALIIFYTLLLSISEFIVFDIAYLVAAIATILLITLYAFGHFRSYRTAGIFAGVLSLLYGFTFVLIRLEDTALLLGSIGLFIILALAMYASRKINWYGEN